MSRFRYSVRAIQADGQAITVLETNDSDLAVKGFDLHAHVIPEHNGLGLAKIVRVELHEDVTLDKVSFLASPPPG